MFRKFINTESRFYKNLQTLYHYLTSIKKIRKHKYLNFNVAITKHCNLNCAYCFAFSPLAHEYCYDVDIFKKDVFRISELTDGKIRELSIAGGEPLLHPRLTEFFDIARGCFGYYPKKSFGNIFVITNGTLLARQPESFWVSCRKNNIEIRITKYPIKLDINALKQTAGNYGVKLICYHETDKTEKRMDSLKLDILGRQNIKDSFIRCFLATDCINLYNGRMYTCGVPVNIDVFNNYFDQNIISTDKDSIDIYKAHDINEIFDFLRKPIPFCRYCDWKNTKTNLPWRISKKEITEWT
ncbi:MAG: radical SAM protein [Spirochaetaceae bacterium]|nr:radical SAM protein [Spirochaetaceae bacterium]